MLQLAIKNRNETINLDRSRITIGREGGNTVVLDAADVSGYYAEIHCEPGGVFIVDLGSTNGTSVNGIRINQRQKLAAWDRVAFGSVEAQLIDTAGRRPTQVIGSMGQARSSASGGLWRLVGQRRALEISGRHVPAPRAAGTAGGAADGNRPGIGQRHLRQRPAGSRTCSEDWG